jgi:hypothetical protein
LSSLWAKYWHKSVRDQVVAGLVLATVLGLAGAAYALLSRVNWMSLGQWFVTPTPTRPLTTLVAIAIAIIVWPAVRDTVKRLVVTVATSMPNSDEVQPVSTGAVVAATNTPGQPSGLTIDRIAEIYNAAQPMQRPHMMKDLLGTPVRWDCEFFDGRQRDERTLVVSLTTRSCNRLVTCDVRPDECPGVQLLHRGHPIEISGQFADYDGLRVELRDATLKFDL